jgi:AcrR family transcriptional regulator
VSSTSRQLVEAAARLLAEQGPRALSARALAREVGTSTMAVYTHFSGMPGVVRAVMREGFERLATQLATVPRSDDPVADFCGTAIAYRRSAHLSPHMYAVMFGGSTIAGFELSDEDRHIGEYTLRIVRDMVPGCVDAGRFRPADSWVIARQMWCHLHGLVMLELSGYLTSRPSPRAEIAEYLTSLMVGLGDAFERAEASVARAFATVPTEVDQQL